MPLRVKILSCRILTPQWTGGYSKRCQMNHSTESSHSEIGLLTNILCLRKITAMTRLLLAS